MNTNCHRTEKNRAYPSAGLGSGSRPSFGSRRGIALVITLIMLSVTLVMALAFLALARRERSSVSTTTDATNAKLAADSALAAAQSQLIANLLNANSTYFKTNGPYNFGLLVSTNYINTNGFYAGYANPANVNYDHLSNSFAALNLIDFEQNVANLQILPRVPVFVPTNSSGALDFRYYLDLNRNGQFDPTAFVDNSITNGPLDEVGDPQWVGILTRPDVPHSAENQFVSRYAFAAIPISAGLDINAIHNQTLEPEIDGSSSSLVNSGYFRNQGVGSWEINLAAFLTDLNINQWDPPGITADQYNYNEPLSGSQNVGYAFQDALSILSYRYGYNASSQAPLTSVFNPVNTFVLYDQSFDLFPYGSPVHTPLNDTFTRYYANNGIAGVNIFWPGSNNTNRYFNLPSDLFNSSETSSSFVQRLTAAGDDTTNYYDRYTFYRLLSQMGTDSDPDDGKMNLNFRNITNGLVVPNMETNLYSWSPLDFFTNAADRMLRMYTTNWFYAGPTNYLSSYYFITNYTGLIIGANKTVFNYNNANNVNVSFDPTGFGLTNVSTSRFLGWTNQVPAFGITNIPVYVNGQFVYSPAVNRILQLAANLYDASTNSYYPSVFRPLFQHDNLGNVYITGFTNVSYAGIEGTVSGLNDPQLNIPLDIPAMTNWGGNYNLMITNTPTGPAFVNAYGVPWIVGAKEGFPNFNKFGMQTFSQTVRRLQVTRSGIPTTAQTTFLTNQLLSFSVSNVINMDCWNSYTNVFTNGPVYIHALDTLSMSLTNNDNAPAVYFNNQAVSNTLVVPNWAAYNTSYPQYSFTNPLSTFSVLLSNADFHFEAPQGFYTDANGWESNYYGLSFPQFGLTVTNHLQLYMLAQSGANYHVIDYVQLGGPQTSVNLTQLIETNNPQSPGYGPYLWSQALNKNNLPWGPANQVLVSESQISSYGGTGYWSDNSTNEAMINGFANFMGLAEPYPNLTLNNPTLDEISTYYASNLTVQVPYTPIVNVSEYTSWQANDPLVHYLSSDLTFNGVEQPSQAPTGVQVTYNPIGYVPKYPTFNSLNDRYQPWGVNKLPTGSATPIDTDRYDTNSYDLSFKDPLIWGSYNWGFPTNKYPTPGWIGRVHRGTPWQTVYLKANNIITNGIWGYYSGINTWAYYTGDFNYYDASNSAPVEDRLLFDLFTTRPNDNAALGTLSVNQTNLAAWSAIFSGMVALTNVGVMPNFIVQGRTFAPSNNWVIVQPAGLAGNASALGRLVTNINHQRLMFTNVDGVVGSFEHIGDILSTPALTEYSPFLNTNVNQRTYGISDATYEWLPQQMMGLLRDSDTSRYLVYGYGQALRPAPGGVDLGSTQFGLVTNYQVVAESDVREVISVQKHVDTSGQWPQTNYTTRVESYSVLPPN